VQSFPGRTHRQIAVLERPPALARASGMLLAGALVLLLALLAPARAHADSGSGSGTSGYVVLYKSSIPSVNEETDGLERAQGFQSDDRWSHAVKGFSAQLTAGQAGDVAADPQVASVTPDQTVEAFGRVRLTAGETIPTGVLRIRAATSSYAQEPSAASVAVIDTGVDLTNPDLNAVSGTNCVTPGAPAQDDNGHGTHVAGIIAAGNDGSGVVGVAPGTRIVAVKVLAADGTGTLSSLICGMDWVAANAQAENIRVANMSVGTTGTAPSSCAETTDPLYASVCRATGAGVTVVAAAGNAGIAFDGARTAIPAAYPEVLTVTAMSDSDGNRGAVGGAPSCRPSESDDTAALYSNFASTPEGAAHTVAAPGTCFASDAIGGGTVVRSGTSMAAPHAAGSVALCLGTVAVPGPCDGLSPTEIVAKMRADADARTLSGRLYGFAGDIVRPIAGRIYGSLIWDGAPSPAPPPA
jgi:subtilisin family serine protease